MAAVVGLSARAGQPKRTIEEKVTVYLENDAGVPAELLSRASGLASEMFPAVDVRIDWRAGQPVGISIVTGRGNRYSPDARHS